MAQSARKAVHILAAERVKLACKRQGERIFAFGEYPGAGVSHSGYRFLSFGGGITILTEFSWRKARGKRFTFSPQSASSSLVSGKAKESSPLANTRVREYQNKKPSVLDGFLTIPCKTSQPVLEYKRKRQQGKSIAAL